MSLNYSQVQIFHEYLKKIFNFFLLIIYLLLTIWSKGAVYDVRKSFITYKLHSYKDKSNSIPY